MRVQATKEKDEAKSTTAKLIGNSSYGKDRVESFHVCSRKKVFFNILKTCEDPSRRDNVIITESLSEVRKYMRKALYKDHKELLDETENPIGYEIKVN